MNFQEYKEYKETLIDDKYLRLDCLNPFKAMDFVKVPEPDGMVYASTDISYTRGVRSSLETLFNAFQNRTIYIPEEVYPVYFELSKKCKYVVPYSIFGDKPHFIGKESVVLHTLSFFGDNELTPKEVKRLVNKGITVIIDAVYDYKGACFEYETHENLFILTSTAKTHLTRNFGITYHMSDIEFPEPEENFVSLKLDNTMPTKQLEIFNERWKQLDNEIVSKPSKHPYLRVIDLPFEELLSQNILGVPMSVFSGGNGNNYKTVISCLYEIDKHVKV